MAPELLYMEAKWSSLVSYGLSLDALQDFSPIALSLDVKTVRYDTLKVAKRLEAELGDEQSSFIEGDPREWALLPPPEGFFKVGIDGGYVRNWFDKKHKSVRPMPGSLDWSRRCQVCVLTSCTIGTCSRITVRDIATASRSRPGLWSRR